MQDGEKRTTILAAKVFSPSGSCHSSRCSAAKARPPSYRCPSAVLGSSQTFLFRLLFRPRAQAPGLLLALRLRLATVQDVAPATEFGGFLFESRSRRRRSRDEDMEEERRRLMMMPTWMETEGNEWCCRAALRPGQREATGFAWRARCLSAAAAMVVMTVQQGCPLLWRPSLQSNDQRQ